MAFSNEGLLSSKTDLKVNISRTSSFRDLMLVSIAIEKTWQQSARARERIETAPEPRMVSQKDYDDTIAAAKERILALSAWSKRNPGATYEDAKKIFGKGDKLFANKD